MKTTLETFFHDSVQPDRSTFVSRTIDDYPHAISKGDYVALWVDGPIREVREVIHRPEHRDVIVRTKDVILPCLHASLDEALEHGFSLVSK